MGLTETPAWRASIARAQGLRRLRALRAVAGAAAAVAMAASCTGKVLDEDVAIQASVQEMAQKSAISLISNSTQSQAICASSNSAVVQLALSSVAAFHCRDRSRLMDSARLGPTCEGGAVVAALSIDSSPRDCRAVTLCGKAPASAIDVAQRIDGTTVKQLTFVDLPWGCDGLIEASPDLAFPVGAVQEVRLQVFPPTCAYCTSAGKLTCQPCSSGGGTGSTLIAGQLIPNSCPGGCTACPGATGTSVPHAGTQPFYASQAVACGQTCSAVASLRVCNNGSWVPSGPTYTSCQEPAASSCTAVTASLSSVLSKAWSSAFPWTARKAASTTGLAAVGGSVTCADCASGSCASCTTLGGSSGYKLYSQQSVPSGTTCESVSQCLTCAAGLFQGDPQFRFGSCAVQGAACSAQALSAPISSGATQTFFVVGAGGCSQVSLRCSDGTWTQQSSGTPVAKSTVDGYALACPPPTDCVTQGGVLIQNGGNRTVFAANEVNGNQSCYDVANYRQISCVNGTISPSDPGATFRYVSCARKTCSDPTDPANVRRIPAGTTATYYSVSAADCSQPDPAAYCNSRKLTAACPNTGGSATVTSGGGTATSYTHLSCSVPSSCSGCQVSTTDAGVATVGTGSDISLYSVPTASVCNAVKAIFSCVAGSGGAAPSLRNLSGASVSNYRYLNCIPEGADEGELGGTGGGTGNDAGPGSALKKRFGADDGSGGPGGPCFDAVSCSRLRLGAYLPRTVKFTPCLMPWGIGEIEHYGSFVAFGGPGTTLAAGSTDTVCVVKPDSCSSHRQLRSCRYPTMTGTDAYRYPRCVEKASCP